MFYSVWPLRTSARDVAVVFHVKPPRAGTEASTVRHRINGDDVSVSVRVAQVCSTADVRKGTASEPCMATYDNAGDHATAVQHPTVSIERPGNCNDPTMFVSPTPRQFAQTHR